jgi:MinD-like ATPase involved in chromosome partitioning or flagellar assembly
LGAWFAAPILHSQERGDLARLANIVINHKAPQLRVEWNDLAGNRREASEKWHIIERHLSKLDWLDKEPAKLIWPLREQTPSIVTFYSFKGGVGRTTALASTAWQLARAGKRVVVIDLDVEAPGIGSLLGVQTERGLVDFLVDHAAIQSSSLDGMLAPAAGLGDDARLVDVIGAGRLDVAYFEKLARLDYSISGMLEPKQGHPVREALRALLESLRRRSPSPDYILLDARAGLHDLAGLSLHDLAHVDVIVGRDSSQGYQGLELTVQALAARRDAKDRRCVVVQTMAPDDPGSKVYEEATREYLDHSYDVFNRHMYADLTDDAPSAEDDTAAHFPAVVRFNQRLIRFEALAHVEHEVLSEDFRNVKERIVGLCQPEEA